MRGQLAVARAIAAACAAGLVAVGCQATIGDPLGSGEEAPLSEAPDAAAVPGNVPDAAAPAPDAEPPLSPVEQCEARYGTVPGFEVCTATEEECVFVALIGNQSCGAQCAARGGQCLFAEDNRVGKCDDLENNPIADCDTVNKIDLLCTCTLPP